MHLVRFYEGLADILEHSEGEPTGLGSAKDSVMCEWKQSMEPCKSGASMADFKFICVNL